MAGPVTLTVYPRLECCVPDYTGKNRVLAGVLAEVQQSLGSQVKIEVVSDAPTERARYYLGMLQALGAAGYSLPFAPGPSELAALCRAGELLNAGLAIPALARTAIREMSLFFFRVTPIIVLNERATFVSTIPTAAELAQAVRSLGSGESR